MTWAAVTWGGWAASGWLGALALLAVPVAIHLFSRGRQRRVALGSVRWLAPADTVRARRIRPSGWWLLAVRCALVGLIVFALAGPRLLSPPDPTPRRWALVAPEVAAERGRLEPANAAAYRRLDQLLADGAQLRWLAPGVPTGPFEAPPERVAEDSWSLAHEASRAAPPGAELEVFALDRAADLRGVRPRVERVDAWHALVDPEANRWIERVEPVGEDGWTVFVGSGDAAGTSFERVEVALAGESAGAETPLPEPLLGPGVAVERTAAGWRVALADGGTVAADDEVVVEREGPTEVAIFFAAERAEDAGYLRAGLAAVGQVAARDLALRMEAVPTLEGLTAEGAAIEKAPIENAAIEDAAIEDAAIEDDSAALVFWLSPQPVPDALRGWVAGGGVLVSDVLERSERCACGVLTTPNGPEVYFDRWGAPDAAGGAAVPLWRDAQLRSLLDSERAGAGSWLRLHARFHPVWTDLVLSPAFPAWLLDLLETASPAGGSARTSASDRRSAPGQAPPRETSAARATAAGVDLAARRWLWLGVLGLLALERRLALGSVT